MPQTDHLAPPDCGGRFAYQSFLGAGGMGAVYEAYDHRRQSQVAIKVMRRAAGAWVYRFKNEFRSLAGIVHPNLVTLHELIEWESQWLFTMELVPGVSFTSAHSAHLSTASTEADPAARPVTNERASKRRLPSRRRRDEPCLLSDIFQISDALCQLCEGLDYLHQRGTAHGDVKPANVLITPDRRVVILDFGIARDLRSEAEVRDGLSLLGTPGYIAPERLEDRLATPSADMFAVGATLFEVLTGHKLDTEPDPAAVLSRTRDQDPDTDAAGVRRELMETLCLRLIAGDPAVRPTAADVRDAVVADGVRAGRKPVIQLGRNAEDSPFVARAVELEAIRNAMLDKRAEAPKLVIVSGESGIGKTELMRRVLDEELPSSCLVLEGKCYEREQVPYRALDRLIDSLSSNLLAVDGDELQALSWADLAVVARMFPVLRRVPEIDRICEKDLRPDDREPREQRRAAAEMLGRLMELVSEGRRLILYIDDLHWGDEESATVLRELLIGVKTLDVRVVACHRLPVQGSPIVSALVGGDADRAHLELELAALAPLASEELARALLGREASDSHVARVASEAGGNPFLIRELTEFGAGLDLDEIELLSAVSRHVKMLSAQARRIVEVLAVAGRRLDIGVARSAADVGQAFEAAVILLRSQHLIKASDQLGEQIEPYHDRIREVIVQGLSPEDLAARHRDLARAIEKAGDPDPSVLGFHLEGAGDPERAAQLLLQAAKKAERSLAPLNAASHYARVVHLVAATDPRHRQALRGQALNLDLAGRGAHAAPLYIALADDAEPAEALKLRRQAAQAWNAAGEFDKAGAVLDRVFAAAGVRLPRSQLGVLARIAQDRVWLRRRKNRYTARNEKEVGAEQLLRIDAYETGASLFAATSLTRAYLAHSARLRESLSAGEPRRVARALIDEVVMGSLEGEKTSRYGLERLRLARDAIEGGEFPEERALVQYATGVHALFNGRYQQVVDILGELANGPDLRRTGLPLRTARSVLGTARWFLGRWRKMISECARWVAESRDRGDEYSALVFLGSPEGQWSQILADDPEGAIQNASATLESPLMQKLAFPRVAVGQTRGWASLYMGRGEDAERAAEFHKDLKTFLRVQRTTIEYQMIHAYGGLARGRAGHASTRAWLKKLERPGLAWAEPVARIIRASLAAEEGRVDESVVALELAIALCERQGYEMFAAAAGWRLGQLLGGDGGEALRAAAETRIAEEGAERPDRVVRTLAPGFGDSV